MKSTLGKKITKKFCFLYFGIFIYLFILFVTFFIQPCYLNLHTQKFAAYCKEQHKKNHDNWLRTKKVIQSHKISKIRQIYINLYFSKITFLIHKITLLKIANLLKNNNEILFSSFYGNF